LQKLDFLFPGRILGMQTTALIDGKQIEYTRRISRGRNIRITLYPGGRMVVSAPNRIPANEIYSFLKKKSKWILGKLQFVSQLPVPDKAASRAGYQANKLKALTLVKDRLEYFNRFYNFPYGRVSIKNHTTLWGSCSRKGNLNFSYKLALIPSHLADYVIVHELCHLEEFNHSPNFWKLVAQTIPDHKKLRSELKKFGLTLA
jgi:predicted metal-dependent hydrolase